MALTVIISCYYFTVIVAQPIHGQREGHGCRGCMEENGDRGSIGQGDRGESLGSSGIWLRFNLRGSPV